MEDTTGSPNELAKSRFEVLDYMVVEDGSIEYKVRYEARSKDAFKQLVGGLKKTGYTATLSGTKQDTTLMIFKESTGQTTSRAPIILFSLTLLSIVITGIFLSVFFQQLSPERPAILMAAAFTVAVLAVLGIHEFAHRYLSREGGVSSSVPYYIPNVPVFTGLPILSVLPTFGSVTFVRKPSLNKDTLFNVYFIGPFMGMIVALIVSVFGAVTSVIIPAAELTVPTVNVGQSVLQGLMRDFTTTLGLSRPVGSGSVYISSPLDIAAWVGFLITFFNLLPAAVFDGGMMTNLVLGAKGKRIASSVTGILLLVIDTPNYWIVVLLIFLLATRPPAGETLDSVSDISGSKKLLYALSLLLLILCVPIPQSIVTVPLNFGK